MSNFVRLYRGKFYEIWITRQESGSQVMDFGRSLSAPVYYRLRSILERTADYGAYHNEEISRHIGDGIYEFKAQTARLFGFFDKEKLILTHGATKPKSVVSERSVAVKIRAEYLAGDKRGEMT